jgi:3-methyladenine DNA glycosylase/8-oxoguanine DNA glycosylase
MAKLSTAKLKDPSLIDNPADASAYLAHHSKILAPIIKIHGPCTLSWRKDRQSHYAALVETICYQQLAGKAAATIHSRVVAAVGGKVTPDAVAATSEKDLRAAGLSNSKYLSIRSLTDHVLSGDLQLNRVSRMEDEDVIEHLVRVRGIGRWSAQMFLIDRFNRLDIWPGGDYGVQVGLSKILKLKTVPKEKEMEALGEPYRPFRSVLAWYCWKSVDAPI